MNNDELTTTRMRRSGFVGWLRLSRVFQKIDRIATEALRNSDLSIAQFDVLAQVGRHEGLTQQELANYLLVTKGNISQLIEKMWQRGLVERCARGRTMRLSLTEKGRDLYNSIIPAYEILLAQQFATLSEAEQHQLRTLLTRLDHALD